MNLQEITRQIFDDYAKSTDAEIRHKSDRGVQQLFTQSYRSRYFLELLQNARDAIYLNGRGKKGKAKFWVKDNALFFANNGAEFNERGIKSICYPAVSPKVDQNMIGHKGIGFLSTLELTNNLEIITNFGTVYFDYFEAAKKVLKNPDEIPLLQFPLFKPGTLFSDYTELYNEGYTTVMKFNLKKEVTEKQVNEFIDKFSGEDLIFLESIEKLYLNNRIISIERSGDSIILDDNGKKKYYKIYEKEYELKDEEISSFESSEKEMFSKDRTIECRFLLKTDAEGTFEAVIDSPLFLYYRLDIESGFPFYIHSYFSVTPDRKNLLEQSKLNEIIFREIAKYYATDFLKAIKIDFSKIELTILHFDPKPNARLEQLYKMIAHELQDKPFIYHLQTTSYKKPSEILLLSKEQTEVFVDGMLGEKYLLRIDDFKISNWMSNLLKIESLSPQYISEQIEKKCEQNIENPGFFTKLYLFMGISRLFLSSKKILLTEHNKLVSGFTTTTYYQRRDELTLPTELENDLCFLNKNIKIAEFNYKNQELGLLEYSLENLISNALRVFKEYSPLNSMKNESIAISIIQFIKSLNVLDKDQQFDIADRILLPVVNNSVGTRQWICPLDFALYFEDFIFAVEYNNDFKKVDISLLSKDDEDKQSWIDYLGNLFVWKIPALIIDGERKEIPDWKDDFINKVKADHNTGMLSISNDRRLDVPIEISEKLSNCLIKNWQTYRELIKYGKKRPLTVFNGTHTNNYSNTFSAIKYSEILRFLNKQKWIVPYANETGFHTPSEIVAMKYSELNNRDNQSVLKYLNVISLDLEKDHDFILDFNIIHIRSKNANDYFRLLDMIYENFKNKEIEDKTGFERFFNRILSFIYDYLETIEDKLIRENITIQFKKQFFLVKSLINSEFKWLEGKDAIHIDDATFLEGLGNEILTAIEYPFAFTKKARNEWGKYGSKIGKKLSKVVQKSLIETSYIPTNITDAVKYFEIIIAFIEDEIGKQLNNDLIQHLISKQIKVHSPLYINVHVEGKDYKIIQLFFVNGNKENAELHIDNEVTGNNREMIISQALASLLVEYVDSELKNMDILILQIIKNKNKKEVYDYAILRGIDEARLIYLADFITHGNEIDLYSEGVKDKDEKSFEVVTVPKSNMISITRKIKESTTTEIEVDLDFDGLLTILGNAVDDKMVLLNNGMLIKNPIILNGNKSNGGAGFGNARNILTDNSKDLVGILAEYYVYKRLMQHGSEMLQLIQYDKIDNFEIIWFNETKLQKPELVDQSRGKGCDIIIEKFNIYIEVKGMMKETPFITITGPELQKMKEVGDTYFLVIVKNLFEEAGIRTTIIIPNPYSLVVNGQINVKEIQLVIP